MIEHDPCCHCGFNDEDYGCTAPSDEPWVVSKDCYLYKFDDVDEMTESYEQNEGERND